MAERIISIHTFIGEKSSTNYKLISQSIAKVEQEFRGKVELRECTVDYEKLRQERWTAIQFCEWLSIADIYIICDHPTLGFPKTESPYDKDAWMPWDLNTFGKLLHQHLDGHVGWPKDVRCPVFLQTKIDYKEPIKEHCLPYLVLQRTSDGHLSKDVRRQIFEFCWGNYELPRYPGQKLGFVLKVPATNFCFGRIFCSSIYDIVKQFRSLCMKKVFSGTPSFWLERKMSNRTEMKVVLTENDVSMTSMRPFFAKNDISCRNIDFKPFATNHDDVIAFAESVKRLYQANCAYALCTPVLRIDILESSQGRLFVNELENLGASVEAIGRNTAITDAKMDSFRSTFFDDKVNEMVRIVLLH